MKSNPLSTISKKITLLNQATTSSLLEGDSSSIIKNFTEVSVKILEADFGFAWCRFSENEPYKLVYKTLNTPNKSAVSLRKKYEKGTRNIIPISYGDHDYGSIVICYKKKRILTKEELALSNTIGNATAQAINTNWLVENGTQALDLAEKQKETETLLSQEKLKTEFVANAAHELRTPLAIIKGNVDLAMLRAVKVPKTTKNYLNAIDNEIKHLSSILSDLSLITTKGRELKSKVSYDKVDMNSLIKVVVERSKTLAYKKNISLTARLIPNLVILGDKVYLEKMLLNLVKNSIIYGNKNGHTKITANKSKGFIKININDDGIGMSKEDLPYVFERFYRADKSHNSDGNSTGLGLSIVKLVAEAHGGTVSVTSNENKGSCFSISLPTKTVR